MTLSATLKWLFYLALTAFFVRISVLLVYKMENQFMSPSLPANSILIGSKWSYGIRFPWSESAYFESFPQVNDIVALEFKNQPGLVFVKRILAGPGDRVKVEKNELFINQKKCDYLPVNSPSEKAEIIETCEAYSITISQFTKDINYPERLLVDGEYFALYDNREFEGDLAQFSIITFNQVLGKIYFHF